SRPGRFRINAEQITERGQPMADAVTVIKQDHQSVGQLFEEYHQAQDSATKGELVRQMTQGLGTHADMEEQILYPRMGEALGKEMVDQNLEEHNTLRQLLGELSAMTPDQSGFDATVEQLISAVLEHVQ